MYQEEEIEYLDYVRPKRNRNKKQKQVPIEQYPQDSRQFLSGQNCSMVLEKIETKEQQGNTKQASLDFQPDVTIEKYRKQLTFIQDQPCRNSQRSKLPRNVQRGRGNSRKEGTQSLMKEDKINTLQRSIQRMEINSNVTPQTRSPKPLQLKSSKAVITMQLDSFVGRKSDIIILPFLTSHLQLYPGQLLKDNLLAQRQKLDRVDIQLGGIYMKGNHQLIDNFRYIVFLKIDLKEFWKHLALGFNSIFNKIKKDGLNVMTILLFLDQKYISVSDVLRGLFASSLKKEEKPLQIQILTTDQQTFKEQSKHFQQYAPKYIT